MKNGMPIEGAPQTGGTLNEAIEPDALDDAWIDEVLGRQTGGEGSADTPETHSSSKPEQNSGPENLLPDGF